MNTKLVREYLIPALRSGEYTQAYGALRRGDSYCCLGVATDIAIRNRHVDGEWIERNKTMMFLSHTDQTLAVGVLSEDVRSLFDFRFSDGEKVFIDGEYELLTTHNDRRKSFAQIASALEAKCDQQEGETR